jgi:hypothetical protein
LASDNFVFNFERFDHHTMTDFHPHFDAHEFDEPTFANTQAILSALHDDGYGNAVAAVGPRLGIRWGAFTDEDGCGRGVRL